uniref:tRNA pseudouridine synthase n=1 Tax=Anopheles epiroticus TaxID=199890 RepID=A0A182PTD3_9DIPT
MNRYLINLSYIGTRFRGIQRKIDKSAGHFKDPHTVQGVIEEALLKLRSVNAPLLKLSSRTDTGVHALHNTVHVDLQRPNGKPYDADRITKTLNRAFEKDAQSLRILSTVHVPLTFHARLCAKSRTYLYRLAVLKREYSCESGRQHPHARFIPIEEHDRCYFLGHPQFDIDTFAKVARMFEGMHDFRTFMAVAKGNPRQQEAMHSVRSIEQITVERGRTMTTALNRERAERYYDFWDVRIRGRSFLYRQVRRMVGAWVAAAEGRITERDIYRMLTVPSQNSWCTNHPRTLFTFATSSTTRWILPIPIQQSTRPTMASFLEQLRNRKTELQRTETTVTYMDGSRKIFRNNCEIDAPPRLGFIVDNSPDQVPACIMSQFLYLGSQDCVRAEVLEKYGITHVLSVGIETPPFEEYALGGQQPKIEKKFVDCLDLPETNLAQVLAKTNAFIDECQARGGRVLVHCNAGVSRSTSVVLGYLMERCDQSFMQAFATVKSKRPCVQPNAGFIKQLKQLQS